MSKKLTKLIAAYLGLPAVLYILLLIFYLYNLITQVPFESANCDIFCPQALTQLVGILLLFSLPVLVVHLFAAILLFNNKRVGFYISVSILFIESMLLILDKVPVFHLPESLLIVLVNVLALVVLIKDRKSFLK